MTSHRNITWHQISSPLTSQPITLPHLAPPPLTYNHITSSDLATNHITSYRITSQHITSLYSTSQRIAAHHITTETPPAATRSNSCRCGQKTRFGQRTGWCPCAHSKGKFFLWLTRLSVPETPLPACPELLVYCLLCPFVVVVFYHQRLPH